MGRRIDDATMDNVELLAKLTLEPKEREKVREEMEQILNYVEKLNELDTEKAAPLVHIFAGNQCVSGGCGDEWRRSCGCHVQRTEEQGRTVYGAENLLDITELE